MSSAPLHVQNILIPTDFSACADHALTHAVDLASRFGAELHILHVVNELDPEWYGLAEVQANAPRLRERIRKVATERLEARANGDGKASDVATTVSLQLSFSVASTIEEYIHERSIDLLVMGTHGRRGVERLMLGNVADKIVRHASCPVITVSEQAPWEQRNQDLSDILVPIDFSASSKQALALAKQVGRLYPDPHLHLMFVSEKRTVPTFSDTGMPGVSVIEMDPDIVANAEKALEQLGTSTGDPDIPLSTVVEQGHVAESIVNYTEENGVDMIVMATRGLTGLDHFILGSTTERVVRVASCPVLTFHGNEDGAP